MRCIAIAKQLRVMGANVTFFVSNEESKWFLEGKGQKAEVVNGNPERLGFADGALLAEICNSRFQAVLVDSYGVTDAFFDGLSRSSVELCFVDDMYTFETGNCDSPVRRDVDIVINYELFSNEEVYEEVYSGSSTKLLIGPRYAPIREEFWGIEFSVSKTVERILITSGSTNPGYAIERMLEGCRNVVPSASFDIVVGGMATFDESNLAGITYDVHRDVKDMAPLMANADLAVSAAGSTLYELSCIGVPTVAVPIVENQIENANGFANRGLGLALDKLDWNEVDLAKRVTDLSQSYDTRLRYSRAMADHVDGKGAERIARCILNSMSSSYNAGVLDGGLARR